MPASGPDSFPIPPVGHWHRHARQRRQGTRRSQACRGRPVRRHRQAQSNLHGIGAHRQCQAPGSGANGGRSCQRRTETRTSAAPGSESALVPAAAFQASCDADHGRGGPNRLRSSMSSGCDTTAGLRRRWSSVAAPRGADRRTALRTAALSPGVVSQDDRCRRACQRRCRAATGAGDDQHVPRADHLRRRHSGHAGTSRVPACRRAYPKVPA